MTFQRMSPCWPWNILLAVFSVGLLGSVASADAAQLRRWKPGWASEIQLVKFPPTSSSVAEQLPDSVRNNHLGAAHGASYRSLPGNWNSHKGWQQGREKCLNYHVQIFHAREKIWKKKKKKGPFDFVWMQNLCFSHWCSMISVQRDGDYWSSVESCCHRQTVCCHTPASTALITLTCSSNPAIEPRKADGMLSVYGINLKRLSGLKYHTCSFIAIHLYLCYLNGWKKW